MNEQLLVNSVVTPDDYKNFTGKDLFACLKVSDNESNYPYIFLGRVQDFLIHWCSENGFKILSLEKLSPTQMIAFKKAVLNQAEYVINNGYAGLGLESGFDQERNNVLPAKDIKRIEVPSAVITLLHESGMFNLKIKNRPRVTRGYPWMGNNEY